MNKTLIINKEEAKQLLTMDETIKAMEEVMKDVSNKSSVMLQRNMIHHENGNKLALMPGSLLRENVTGGKIIIFPGKEAKKNGTNQGIVPLFDITTGSLIAIVDGEVMTIVRTAAVSACATDYLSRKDASTLAILGTGNQGIAHIEAILNVRDIKEIYLWNYNNESGRKAGEEIEKRFHIKTIYFDSAEDAVKNAHIICTTSKATEPILKGSWIKKGTHINAVGACSPLIREVDTDVLKISKVFVDQREASLRDGGDLVIPIKDGEISEDVIVGELGDVISGNIKGREDCDHITFFESVGLSLQDIGTANLIYKKAVKMGMGTYVAI